MKAFPTSTGLIQRKDSGASCSKEENQVSRQKQGPEVPGDGLDVSSRHAACGRGINDGAPYWRQASLYLDTQCSVHCLDTSWIAFLGGNVG